MGHSVSVVIRAKNEEKWIGKLLTKLRNQTFKNFEIILVNNQSTDNTVGIAQKFSVDKILNISDKEFSYSKALNLGIQKARGKFIVIVSAHCIPISNMWLERGLAHLQDSKVAGVDGYTFSFKGGTLWQRVGDILYFFTTRKIRENYPLTNTNAIIRKSLWQKYPFNETLPECEDYDWSQEMFARGYKTIREPAFTVYHCHPLTFLGWKAKRRRWAETCQLINARKRPNLKNKNRII